MTEGKTNMRNEAISIDPKQLAKELRSSLPQLEERLAKLKEAQVVSQDLLKLEVSF